MSINLSSFNSQDFNIQEFLQKNFNSQEFNIQEFLQAMNISPYVLFLGSGFKIDLLENKRILGIPWNCVITSIINDNNALIDALDNEKRKTRYINQEEVNNSIINSINFCDKNNLKVVRLFDEGAESFSSRNAQKRAEKCFSRVMQSIGIQAAKLFILGYKENDRFNWNSMSSCFADSDALKEVKTFIFDTDVDVINKFFKLREEDRDSYNIKIYFKSLSDYLDDYQGDEQFDEDDPPHINADDYVFYARGKQKKLGKREYLDKYQYFHLLHEQEFKNPVKLFLIENYFYTFLKQSPYDPQWYGYHEKNKFYLERDMDETLYHHCLTNLEKPGDLDQRPIVVVGNSGSGKSIAVSRLAYRIFQEHKYPVIFQNRQSNYDEDSRSTCLDEFLKFLEENGAPSVLLIIDQSAVGDAECDKMISLFLKLRNRGRNLAMVFTAYSIDDDYSLDDNKKTNQNSNKKSNDLTTVFMNDMLSDEEQKKLRTLLKRKAKKKTEEIEELVNLSKTQKSFLAFLYYAFIDLRRPLTEGVYKQFQRTIQSAIKQDLQNDLKNLLISVAIAGLFKVGFPSNLAYRLMRSLNEETISTIARIHAFHYEDTEDGSYEFSVRTPLEATMLLNYFNMTPEMKVGRIEKMLNMLRSEKNEISFMIAILRYIGPNAPAKYKNSAQDYRDFYDIIIEGLKNFREQTGGDPRMTLQEITYIREQAKYLYSNALLNDKKISDKEYVEKLERAIAIGDEVIRALRIELSRNPTIANLLVEIATSRLYLYEFDSSAYNKDFLEQARDDLLEVISSNPDRNNSAYAYTVLLRTFKAEIEKTNEQDSRKLELLAKAYDLIERVESEYVNIYENNYFYSIAQDIVSYFEDPKYQKLADKMFDDMISRGKSVGIYWRVRQHLREAGINPFYRKKIELTDEQVSICREICRDFLENPEYRKKTDLDFNPECQRLLLHVVWLIYDKYPLFCEYEHRTGITPDGWHKLKDICSLNYEAYKMSKDYYIYHRFLYVLALCHAQLDEPQDCQDIIRIIRNETDTWNYDERIRVHHIICDKNRIPKSNFAGNFVDIKTNDGHININGWSGNYGKTGIYFHKRNLHGLFAERGSYYKDFQLGLGYMGLSVFHGLKAGE